MTDQPNPPQSIQPPRAIVKKMRWPFPVVWIVPIAAACLTGFYLYKHHQENGVTITIEFEDGAGIKPNETTLALHGVPLGKVRDIQLTHDHQRAIAHVQIQSSAEFLAKANTVFWIVRPEISIQNITGLNTLVSGPYIDCRPGEGDREEKFVALSSAPDNAPVGVKIILSADQIGQLSVDSPVNYRGIQVGVVKDIRLSNHTDAVNVTIIIWDRYRTLVRMNSQFWMLKGADIQGSLLGGLKLKLGSVQNFLSGGIGFATPEKTYGLMAPDSTMFPLHDQPDDVWLKWKAIIPLSSDEPGDEDHKSTRGDNKKTLPTVDKKS